MIRHETLNPPIHIYPVNEWKIIETDFYARFLSQTETLFAIGNGYVGKRGNHDEGIPQSQVGTFINGFHVYLGRYLDDRVTIILLSNIETEDIDAVVEGMEEIIFRQN